MKAVIFLCCALLLVETAWGGTPTCPTGMTYNPCGSGCPASCTNPSPLCLSVCVPGCFCPTGMVLNGSNSCVNPSDCPAATTSTPASTGTTSTSTSPPCAAGFVHQTCGTACPITCQNKDNQPQTCTLQCVIGCFCAAGTILDTVTGSCVSESNCPAANTTTTTTTTSTPSPPCAAGMVHETCGTACPITCQNKDNPPQVCPTVCVNGCFCAASTILDTVTGSCVSESDCPAANTTATATTNTSTPSPPCAAGMVHETCGTACPITCQNKNNPPQVCPTVCVNGCFCAAGTILDTVTGSCVNEFNCPVTCAAGMVHETCGTACPITCQNKDNPPQVCPLVCVNGCFCAAGTILDSITGSCVSESDCPVATTSPNSTTSTAAPSPPVFELPYLCPDVVAFGACVIEDVCLDTGSQDCGSSNRLCCSNGCGGKVCRDGILPTTPLCAAAREKALNQSQGLLGALVPQCETDGSFSPMQCFEGSCWCVNTTTGVSTSLLAAPGLYGSLECAPTSAPTTSNPPDACSLAPESGLCEAYMPHMFFNSTSGQCERFIYGGCGGNDNRFTSYISCMQTCAGVTVPDSALQATLSETLVCPSVSSDTVGTCENSCTSDNDCSDNKKCCSNGCGQTCVKAVSVPFYTSPQACPKPLLPICSLLGCQSHDACGDSNLCCPTGCGSICMTALKPANRCPEVSAYAYSLNLIGSYIPQCETDGSFSAQQCHASINMCWCVNTTTGEALTAPSSASKKLDCSSTGTSTSSPPDVCSLAPETGPCKGYMPRVFYNSTSRQCEQFIYGGCQGNDNRFTSVTSCMQACGPRSPNCDGIQCDWPQCPGGAKPITDSQHCCPYCAVCSAGGLQLGEGQVVEDGCSTCSCRNATIVCNALICPIPIIRTMKVGMTYDGDYNSISNMDEFKNGVKRTLMDSYSSSHSLQESQITGVEVTRGSIVVTVVVADNKDRSGANVTLLIIQMEQDYKKGDLLIPLNDGTIRPASSFVYTPHNNPQTAPATYVYGIVGAMGFILLALIVVVLISLTVIIVFVKKTPKSHTRIPGSPSACSENEYGQFKMKNPMFDLEEKA